MAISAPSIFTKLPVTTMMAQRFEPTLFADGNDALHLGRRAVPAGVLAAWKAGTWIDRLIMDSPCSASRCRCS